MGTASLCHSGNNASNRPAYVLAMENGFITGSVIDIDGGGLL